MTHHHTISDTTAGAMRRSLLVGGDLPDERCRRIRWLALLHHRRARLAAPAAWREASPDDAA